MLEVAIAGARNRLVLKPSTENWLELAISVESLHIAPLTVALCLASVQLPGEFHRDPADRLIVALARQLDATLCTADGKILAYPHVRLLDAKS